MKIRFIQTLSTTREVFRRNHEYDLDDATARQYIAANVAQLVGKENPKRPLTAAERNAKNN